MRENIEQHLKILSNGLMRSWFDIRSFKPRRAATVSYNARLYWAVYCHVYFRGRVDTLLSEYAYYYPYC